MTALADAVGTVSALVAMSGVAVVHPQSSSVASPVATVLPSLYLLSEPTPTGGALASFDVVVTAPLSKQSAFLDAVWLVWQRLDAVDVNDVRVVADAEHWQATMTVTLTIGGN
jgi:hypothetical protein